MDTAEIERLLSEFFTAAQEPDFFSDVDQYIIEPESTVRDVRTFNNAMLMTRDNGVVVKFRDGSEFQITVVQTVPADEPDYEDD